MSEKDGLFYLTTVTVYAACVIPPRLKEGDLERKIKYFHFSSLLGVHCQLSLITVEPGVLFLLLLLYLSTR